MPLLLLCLLAFLPNDGELVTALPAHRETVLNGFTRARATLEVVSEVSARCSEVMVDVGQTLPEHGTFAALDDTFVALELDQNRARQEQSLSRVAYLDKEVRRFADLFEKATIPRSQLDEIEQQLDQAKLELKGLRIAERELIERIERHRLPVPSGWRVIDRSLEPGQWVSAGMPVGRAGDFRTLVVPFSLDEGAYRWIREQGTLSLDLPDYEQTIIAEVLRISPGFDETTRKVNLDLIIREGMPEWRGGIRCELTVMRATEQGVVLLPENALEQRYSDWWLERPDGERVKVAHQGHAHGGLVRVSSPLIKAGDMFAVRK